VRIIFNWAVLITLIFILARTKEKPHALRRGVWGWGSPSFEQSLAFCYSQADPDNQTILYNAFEHLFFKFAKFKDD